jgi:hypothetical protein
MVALQVVRVLLLALSIADSSRSVAAAGPAGGEGFWSFDVSLSQRFAAALVEQTITRTDPISRTNGRTQVTGSGDTSAGVTLRFIPRSDAAEVELILEGNTRSRTTAEKGPVHAHNSNLTTFTARKQIILDSSGFRESPTAAMASQSTVLEGFSTRLRYPVDPIVRRIAYRVYQRDLDQRLLRVAGQAAEKVATTADRLFTPEIETANRRWQDDILEPMRRRELFPESLQFSTDADQLHMRGRLGSGARVPPPPADHGADLSIRLHESALNTVATRTFGGKSFTTAAFAREFLELPSATLRKGTPTDKAVKDGGLLEITFAREMPIEVRFADEKVSITIRASKFRVADMDQDGMTITAVYGLHRTEGGVLWVREKDLVILPMGHVPGQNELTARQSAMRTILGVLFGELFKDTLECLPLSLPAGMGKTIDLKASGSKIANGWLVLDYRMIASRPDHDPASRTARSK